MFVQQTVYTVQGNFGADQSTGGSFYPTALNIPTNPTFNENYATVMELLRVDMQATWDKSRRANQNIAGNQWGGMTAASSTPADGVMRSAATKLYCSLTKRSCVTNSNNFENSLLFQWAHNQTSAEFNYLGTWEWAMTTGMPTANKPAVATQTAPAQSKITWDCSDGAGNGILVPEPYLQIQTAGTLYAFADDVAVAATVSASTYAWWDVTLTYRMRNVTTQQAIAARTVLNRLAIDIEP